MALERYEGKATKRALAKRTRELVAMNRAELEPAEKPQMADYLDGDEPYKFEPHSEQIVIERERLEDDSYVYNVRFRQVDGVKLRIGCLGEREAWDFADELARVAHVTILDDAPSIFVEK